MPRITQECAQRLLQLATTSQNFEINVATCLIQTWDLRALSLVEFSVREKLKNRAFELSERPCKPLPNPAVGIKKYSGSGQKGVVSKSTRRPVIEAPMSLTLCRLLQSFGGSCDKATHACHKRGTAARLRNSAHVQ